MCHYNNLCMCTYLDVDCNTILFVWILCINTAGKPKKQGALITICLMLGPDFISDSIVVETADHARLQIAIAMNNIFRVC